ncbi:MAG: serine/threonine protein kinase, partial [Rivularia sp. ALOHA_DT_140]|nr:serine/threonine protein kinase [Rivularia sp. ALOHA_DT_140]
QPTPTPNVAPIIQPTVALPSTPPNINPEVETPVRPQTPQTINPPPEKIPQPTKLSPPGDFIETPVRPQIEQPSPAKTVENYYLNINQGEYKTAWNQLSQQFKENKGLHPNGYFSYLSWWRGKVENVNIDKIEILEANIDTAIVDASLNYLMKNGRIIPKSVRFFLSWDAPNRRWVVKDAT